MPSTSGLNCKPVTKKAKSYVGMEWSKTAAVAPLKRARTFIVRCSSTREETTLTSAMPGRPAQWSLELISSAKFSDGVVKLHYAVRK
jgi:hypothetical protein